MIGKAFSVINKKDFFKNLLSWENKAAFDKLIKKSLSSSVNGLIPGVLLYTDEDEELALYMRKNFDAVDKLTGNWCTVYLLENPSPKWRKANHNWKKMLKSGLDLSWFRTKPYDKSEAYEIARHLNVDFSNIPCLVLISPVNLSQNLVLPIEEVSPKYFRKLFSKLEILANDIISKKQTKREINSQVFDYLKRNLHNIGNYVENCSYQQQENLKPNITIEVFLSYADADHDLRQKLEDHLAILQKEKVINTWHKGKVNAGEETQREIEQHLNSAQIILLLISSDFSASDNSYEQMHLAIKRHQEGTATVIPVILRSVDWQNAAFSQFTPLPKNGKPVTSWDNQDEAFADVAQGIRQAVTNLISNINKTSCRSRGKR